MFYLHWRNSKSRNSSQGFEQMTKNVDDWDVDDGFELAEELVSNHGPEHGAEVAEHGEGVVDGGAPVVVKVELGVDVDTQDGLHPIVRQSLTELIAKDQEDWFRIGCVVCLQI